VEHPFASVDSHSQQGPFRCITQRNFFPLLAQTSECSILQTVMDSPRARKLRLIYVLALAQLVGGPLVLLQITLLCKLTLQEAPRVGMVSAAVQAWRSDHFQSVLTAGVSHAPGDTKSKPPARDPQPNPEKAKSPMILWSAGIKALITPTEDCEAGLRAKFWTPAWPHAPPGPPPRLG
jgi:hypothetical protein